MNIIIKILTISLCILFCSTTMHAEKESDFQNLNKRPHSIIISGSDGFTLGVASFLGMGLSDAILGTTRTDQNASGLFAIGYRYSLNRFRVGLDFAFISVSSKITYNGDVSPSIKEKGLNFMILPSAECLYYKKNFLILYGSFSGGIDITRYTNSALSEIGKKYLPAKSELGSQFAYQINPIGLRVGNEFIDGFIEAGIGYRGFFTAGVNLNF